VEPRWHGAGTAGRRAHLRCARQLQVALYRLLGDGDRRLPDRLDFQAVAEGRACVDAGASVTVNSNPGPVGRWIDVGIGDLEERPVVGGEHRVAARRDDDSDGDQIFNARRLIGPGNRRGPGRPDVGTWVVVPTPVCLASMQAACSNLCREDFRCVQVGNNDKSRINRRNGQERDGISGASAIV
jgi:hypothetical protein